MKLTGLQEEKRETIADAGMELTDAELNEVAGGRSDRGYKTCPNCGKRAAYVIRGGKVFFSCGCSVDYIP